jgi:hypothetical protein
LVADRRAIISKRDMDIYVHAIMNSIEDGDEELLPLFQNGRSVLQYLPYYFLK